MPRVIATIVSAGKATLKDLQSFYALRDAYDLVEIIAIDAANQRKLYERQARRG